MNSRDLLRAWGRFAQTTLIVSADLKTRIVPCQFGGDPDCSQCGCIASMGLAAIGCRRVVPGVTAGTVLHVSIKVGRAVSQFVAKKEEGIAG